MLRILSIIGTRPEAIKMAPVIRELERHPQQACSIVCVTGQHRQMLDPVLALFGIEADCDLDLMQPDQSLSHLTAELFRGLDTVVRDHAPGWILAQGDTTSVMVGAMVAFYHRIPFGHVEAGLRTGDRYQPFPEEVNRRIADGLSEILFAPTPRSRDRLLQEGISASKIIVTGNTIVDALKEVAAMPVDLSAGPLAGLPLDQPLVLVTAHRRESFGGQLQEICLAVRELASTFESAGVHFVYPVHLNPNVRRPAYDILSGLANVHLLDPLDYRSLVQVMKRSILVLTDSGGIQEEAPGLGIPVLVMRNTTERPEGVEAGVARLVGTRRSRIVREAASLLQSPERRSTMVSASNPYGDGQAAQRIVGRLLGKPVPAGAEWTPGGPSNRDGIVPIRTAGPAPSVSLGTWDCSRR